LLPAAGGWGGGGGGGAIYDDAIDDGHFLEIAPI
jgi:hypothetical protein